MLISIGYGFSLLVNAWAFYRISGGLFNPAVVLGMVLTGSLPAMRGLFLFPAEILGGIVAAALASCMFPMDIDVVQTKLAPGVSVARGVFIEMFLTALLLFTIHMLAAEKWKATFMAPVGIGLALFVAELAGVYATGGSLNPARSFGPAVVATDFVGYHWIYWVGPAMGSLLTALYYRFVKAMNYEEANPGQDSAEGDFH
jgi:aquaporin related protein